MENASIALAEARAVEKVCKQFLKKYGYTKGYIEVWLKVSGLIG